MQVVEVITFKAKAGVTQLDVIEANKEALNDLEKLNGFLYRSLSFNQESETWTDVVYWENKEIAKKAGDLFFQSTACQNLMDIIEKESTHMQLSDILYSSECSESKNSG